jgi:hypothetical protein
MEAYAVEWTEWLVRTVLFWEPDDVRKGIILRTIHHAGTYSLATLILVSHTIYPAFWLQTIVLGIYALVWIHQVLTHGCVISKVEQKLIGDSQSFVDPFLTMFRIEATHESTGGIIVLGSTLIMCLLSMEWLARLHHKAIPVLMQVLASAPHLVSSSFPNIPPPLSSP